MQDYCFFIFKKVTPLILYLDSFCQWLTKSLFTKNKQLLIHGQNHNSS